MSGAIFFSLTSQLVGLTIAESFLLRADQVIE
jgi:hypothetical protein